jgi:signal transduction histidine kinase
MNLALLQLLENACKYSKPGTEVRVELNRHEEYAEVLVTNDGCPIREDEKERVFERFYRGTATIHTSSGAGLGLYVARKIVHAHGGHLDLYRNRTVGETTTFRIRLPIIERELHNGDTAD